MSKHLLAVLFGTLVMMPLSVFASPIPVVNLNPTSPLIVTAGDTLAVTVSIVGVTDLSAYQFDVAFDPNVLQATAVTELPFLASSGSTFFLPGVIDNGAGSINDILNTLIGITPGVSGNGNLFAISFDALTSATTAIALTETTLLDSTGNLIIQTVPEPNTLLLWGSASVIMLVNRRRFGRRPVGNTSEKLS